MNACHAVSKTDREVLGHDTQLCLGKKCAVCTGMGSHRSSSSLKVATSAPPMETPLLVSPPNRDASLSAAPSAPPTQFANTKNVSLCMHTSPASHSSCMAAGCVRHVWLSSDQASSANIFCPTCDYALMHLSPFPVFACWYIAEQMEQSHANTVVHEHIARGTLGQTNTQASLRDKAMLARPRMQHTCVSVYQMAYSTGKCTHHQP